MNRRWKNWLINDLKNPGLLDPITPLSPPSWSETPAPWQFCCWSCIFGQLDIQNYWDYKQSPIFDEYMMMIDRGTPCLWNNKNLLCHSISELNPFSVSLRQRFGFSIKRCLLVVQPKLVPGRACFRYESWLITLMIVLVWVKWISGLIVTVLIVCTKINTVHAVINPIVIKTIHIVICPIVINTKSTF